MKDEFNSIYQNLFRRYENENFTSRGRPYQIILAEYIRDSISEVDEGNRLRPDAKYFLLVNFHQLIVMPMINSSSFRGIGEQRQNLSEFREAINSDINIIVNKSIQKLSNGISQVSGHQIMVTIDELWRDLKTTSFDIWG